jgi:serine/threonine-protein kinase
VSAQFEPGGRIGDYTLLRRLAIGGMGEIWLAERQGISGFSKRVVIKTILECFADEPSLVDMFLDEGRIAAGLTHPNVAQTYDLGQVGRTYYLAMEYIQGRDLRKLLLVNVERGQLLPLNLVLRILAEVCEGLYYAHRWKTPDGRHAGIVHRDISPQNILVTFDGKVKIIDFGIAKAAQSASRTQSGVLKGKYAYMSPEQVRGKPLDQRSDLFSLGVVMYELLTARRLFKRDSELSTLDAVLTTEIPPPTRIDGGVPREVEAVLLKALARDPDDRFQDARQMQLALEEVMLVTKMPASSAHLAAYMEELFADHLEQEQEQEQESISRLSRQMERLPGAADKAPRLERTTPFAPGMELSVSTDGRRRELTRNLMPGSSQAERAGRGRSSWRWALIGLLLAVVGAGGWFLATETGLLGGGGPDPQPADPQPAPPAATGDAAGGPSDAGPDRQPDPPDDPQQADLGLDLSEPGDPPDAGGGDSAEPDPAPDPEPRPDPGRNVARASGRLSVTTSPPADIYLGRRKLGRGTVRGVRLRPGRYRLRAVLEPGVVETQRLRIGPGERLARNIEFAAGKLRVIVVPWADVVVDGRKVGQTPMAPIELPAGSHRVVLTNPELNKRVVRKVRIRPKKESAIELDWR